MLQAPATKQIQVDSIFAVRSKLRQLRAPDANYLHMGTKVETGVRNRRDRAPATIKTLPSLPLEAAVVFC